MPLRPLSLEVREVLDLYTTGRNWALEVSDCLSFLKRMPERSVSLVFFSPPYESARTYSIGFSKRGEEWVEWMREVVIECCRVSAGLVAINMSGKVEDRRYSLAPEKLAVDLDRYDGIVTWPSPYSWVKMEDRDGARPNGIPGSGGSDCQRRDWEPVYCFCYPSRLPLSWTDNLAFGLPVEETSFGGEFSNRDTNGKRANDRENGKPTWQHDDNGKIKGAHRRIRPKIANAGNVIRVPVGGGKLGHPLAHESEAPMPLGLAERFVCWFAAPKPYCTACMNVLEFPYAENSTKAQETSILPTVQKLVSGESLRAEVLQQNLCGSGSSAAERKVSVVRGKNINKEKNAQKQVLQPEMLQSPYSSQSKNNQVQNSNPEGVCSGFKARTPDGDESRIRHGTQATDVRETGENATSKRSSSSQKFQQIGQSVSEFGIDGEEKTRQSAQTKKTNCVSKLRTYGSGRTCPKCGCNLDQPGAIGSNIVLDPFVGSGTTIDAALRHGRRGIGCDIRAGKGGIETATRRLKQVENELENSSHAEA